MQARRPPWIGYGSSATSDITSYAPMAGFTRNIMSSRACPLYRADKDTTRFGEGSLQIYALYMYLSLVAGQRSFATMPHHCQSDNCTSFRCKYPIVVQQAGRNYVFPGYRSCLSVSIDARLVEKSEQYLIIICSCPAFQVNSI
jgi:hypothetical protein